MSVSGTLEKAAHHQDPKPQHHPHGNQPSPGSTRAAVPPPYSAAAGGEAPPELRGSLDCWACSVLVTAQNLVIAAVNACLAGLVCGSILTPAIVMVLFGFLCHSAVRPHGTSPYCSEPPLTDGGCVALLVVGFVLATPLLVLALAAYCRLARHLRLGLRFIPYSRAVYKNPPATRHRCCPDGGAGKGKVWV